MKSCFHFLIWLILSIRGLIGAENWSQYQGPDQSGSLDGVSILTSWPEGGPKEVWKVSLGRGFGGASIRDGKVFVLDRVSEKANVLRCFELKDGKEIWKWEDPVPGKVDWDGSRNVPAVGEKYVFAVDGFGNLYCVDLNTHKLVWKKHIPTEYQTPSLKWGFAQSPLLLETQVVIAAMGPKAGLVALEIDTGKEIWRSAYAGSGSYSSPTLRTVLGEKQICFLSTAGYLAFEPTSGKTLWEFKNYSCRLPIPLPTHVPDGRIFLTGGYGAGSVMIKISKEAGQFKSTGDFRINGRGAQIHQALYYKDHIYANFNTNECLKRNPEGLVCIDGKGQICWSTKSKGVDRGALIRLGDHILSLGGTDGILRLIQPDPRAYKELAQAVVLKGSAIWAPMAYADGLLVIRDQSEMKCLRIAN